MRPGRMRAVAVWTSDGRHHRIITIYKNFARTYWGMRVELSFLDDNDESPLSVEQYSLGGDEVVMYLPAPDRDELDTQLDNLGTGRDHTHMDADMLYDEVIEPTLDGAVSDEQHADVSYHIAKELCTKVSRAYAYADTVLPLLDQYGPDAVPEDLSAYRSEDAVGGAFEPATDLPEAVDEEALDDEQLQEYLDLGGTIETGLDIRELDRDELARFRLEGGDVLAADLLDHIRDYRATLSGEEEGAVTDADWDRFTKLYMVEQVNKAGIRHPDDTTWQR